MSSRNRKSAIATVAPATVSAPAQTVTEANAETIRPVETLLSECFVEDGNSLMVKAGAQLSPVEFALVITHREHSADKSKSQARFAYYSAGLLARGIEIQKEIEKAMATSMSKSAIDQLRSEAMTLVPLALANGWKAPLSILKDAKAALAVDVTGKILPDEKQTPEGKVLIPLLAAGTVTQDKVREIRKIGPYKNVTTPTTTTTATTPASAGTSPASAGTPTATTKGADVGREFGEMLGHLNKASEYLAKNKLVGDELKMAEAAAINVCRHLGLVIATPGK